MFEISTSYGKKMAGSHQRKRGGRISGAAKLFIKVNDGHVFFVFVILGGGWGLEVLVQNRFCKRYFFGSLDSFFVLK